MPGTDSFDLNLLRVFAAVLREGSITAAAVSLGLTQSAISHSLSRMRLHFGDPLFVRTTQGMRPTAYAQTLASSLLQGLETIRSGLAQQTRFDPSSSTRTFHILTTDIAELMLFPRLLSHLNRVAPSVTLMSAQLARAQYREALESGSADLAIGKLPTAHSDFHQQRLFDVPIVALLRADHPCLDKIFTMRSFMDCSHVAVSEPAQVESMVKRALGKRAAQRRIALGITHYLAVPAILSRSDMIAVMPKVIEASLLEQQALTSVPLPFKMPPIRVVQFWHKRSHGDLGHRWLRRKIAELFAQ